MLTYYPRDREAWGALIYLMDGRAEEEENDRAVMGIGWGQGVGVDGQRRKERGEGGELD